MNLVNERIFMMEGGYSKRESWRENIRSDTPGVKIVFFLLNVCTDFCMPVTVPVSMFLYLAGQNVYFSQHRL